MTAVSMTDAEIQVALAQDPRAHRVMGVLGRRGLEIGAYSGPDEADAMAWCGRETLDVLAAIDRGSDPGAVLTNTGWWDDELTPFPQSIRDELLDAARPAEPQRPGGAT